jgi:hypothetical protein
MTDLNRRNAHGALVRRRTQLVADGVVASYIHDISARHDAAQRPQRPWMGKWSKRGS